MKIIKTPTIKNWISLCKRPEYKNEELSGLIGNILQNVKRNKDAALFQYASQFENTKIDHLEVSRDEIDQASGLIKTELKEAIATAYKNIYAFHKAQKQDEPTIETISGVKCWRKNVGIEKVGLYIPGGSAPLFSTILMLGIPAKIAACNEIILCTPPTSEGEIHPAILYTANCIGINKIYKVGGAQAIAAMAYGTESVPKVDKIFGPGNQYVTKAKELVQQTGVAIDMPAGPSELLVIADSTCNPRFVAADLLSQAEHGEDSQVILLSDNLEILKQSITELELQLENLPRKNIAKKALSNSKAILFNTISDCLDFSNAYAPEHLIIASKYSESYESKIINAGSVFLGNYSCESAGDYASGTNHTLPTNGYAKSYSGVSVDSFVKKITFQQLNKVGLMNIGNTVELMAEAEGLDGHKNAITLRLNEINNV